MTRLLWWRRGREHMASCREALRELQSYLDGEIDELTAERVRRHLEACRHCGLEAEAYQQIKVALARQAPHVDHAAIERLRAFGVALQERAGTGSPEPAE